MDGKIDIAQFFEFEKRIELAADSLNGKTKRLNAVYRIVKDYDPYVYYSISVDGDECKASGNLERAIDIYNELEI